MDNVKNKDRGQDPDTALQGQCYGQGQEPGSGHSTTMTMLIPRPGARIRTQHYKDHAKDKGQEPCRIRTQNYKDHAKNKDRGQDPDTALKGPC